MKILRLTLKKKWFDMTDPTGKTEDYREINEYWLRRLFWLDDLSKPEINEVVQKLNLGWSISLVSDYFLISIKHFDVNIMTLGYPKAADRSRIKAYQNKGIVIAKGRQLWGADPDKYYFVIKHGQPAFL